MRKGKTMLMTSILAVYRSCPVMIVAETEEGVLLELSLNEPADVYELFPPSALAHVSPTLPNLSRGLTYGLTHAYQGLRCIGSIPDLTS
jgi:hypothetical protein